MKKLQYFILEKNGISKITLNEAESNVSEKLDEETYVVYEFSLNDLQSDNYLFKCAHTTYKNRLIIARSWDWGGIRFHMHILKVRELKNCFAEYPKEWRDTIYVWKAPEELQGKDPKEIEKFIKDNSDEIDKKDLMTGDKIKLNIRR